MCTHGQVRQKWLLISKINIYYSPNSIKEAKNEFIYDSKNLDENKDTQNLIFHGSVYYFLGIQYGGLPIFLTGPSRHHFLKTIIIVKKIIYRTK